MREKLQFADTKLHLFIVVPTGQSSKLYFARFNKLYAPMITYSPNPHH
jgi:hypothetical protein